MTTQTQLLPTPSCEYWNLAPRSIQQVMNALRHLETNLSHGVINDLLSGHVGLVANEQLVHVFTGITVDFSEPLTNVVE